MKAEPTRRQVLAGGTLAAGSALAAGTLTGCGEEALPGTLGGADWKRGHLLRDGRFPEPEGAVEDVDVVIAGGGIAGLATGWRLAEAGFDRFVLFELEDRTGGNARSGRNAVSAYPLGAHYLPVPNREASALRHMLRQFGMMTGERDGVPVYDPYQLCADLEERLLWRGHWQEGLFPRQGITAQDRAQHEAFERRMAEYRAATGTDGKPAFAIPMAFSSEDPRFRSLDRETFAAWLDKEGFTSGVLRAWLRYGCRDDYGSEPEHVSAWAGIHYFAGRRGWATDGDGDRELTWPEGNDRLAARMSGRIAGHLRPAHTVFRVAPAGDGAHVDVFDHRARRSRRLRAKVAVLAMPHFVAARVAPGTAEAGGFSYAPWVTANVTVARHPEGKGTSLAWDNVSTASESLGYVVATHQSEATDGGKTVLTWYMPLSREDPKEARKIMMTRPLRDWQAVVRSDLLAMNPDLVGAIERIDVWRWGHAMVRPSPGFLSDPARRAANDAAPPILFAHSDLSGLSLFEEAHHRGVIAAEKALDHLGHAFESLA